MWKGSVGFGMVNIPVKLYKSTDSASSVGLCNVHAGKVATHKTCGTRTEKMDDNVAWCPKCQCPVPDPDILMVPCNTAVKEPKYCPACEKMLDSSELQKAYPEDRKKEHCIPISEDELAALPLASAHVIQIDGLIKNIPDLRYNDEVYVLEPDEGGDRAYALLEKTLGKMGVIGVAKITTGSKEHLCGILPTGDGLLYVVTLHWASDLRDTSELKRPKAQVSDKEMQMAEMLMNTLTQDIDLASYTNEYGEALKRLVEAKKKGIKIDMPEAAPVKEVDLIDQLMASLKQREPEPAGYTMCAKGQESIEV
jgi:DNA end-binding protein Ku